MLFEFISSGDPKNAFLEKLDGAAENLRLFKADMLDYATLTAAFAGCEGVFHAASPVPDGRLVDPEASVSSTSFGAGIQTLKILQGLFSLKYLCMGKSK
jgi:hypothetical protein